MEEDKNLLKTKIENSFKTIMDWVIQHKKPFEIKIDWIKKLPKTIMDLATKSIFYRIVFLFGFTVISVLIAWCIYYSNIAADTAADITADTSVFKDRFLAHILFAVTSIPILFILWFFRTHDTREQITKTQENINTSLFNKGVDLITTEDKF